MSEFEDLWFDPQEYADELGYTDELARSDFSNPAAIRAETKEERIRRGMTRRDLLVKGGIGAAALSGVGALAGRASAAEQAGKFTGTLTTIALTVEWPAGLQAQAESDLGFKFNIRAMGTNALLQTSLTAPDSFDIGGLYNYQMFPIWPTGAFQPVDRTRIKEWGNFYPLFTKGKVLVNSKKCVTGQGDAPFRVIFLDKAGSSGGIGKSTGLPLTKEGPTSNKQIVQWWDEATNKPYGGKPQPRWILGPPAHFNMDSMGYNKDVINKEPTQVSWRELLNPAWKGRVALLNDPAIAMEDVGNAVKALGLMKIGDLGNMTKAEIDRITKIMISYKKKGQFKAFWATFEESVNLMASKEVVLESMWSPAVALLVAQGVNVHYARPPEGMRGWCSCQAIPKHVTGDKLNAVYDYLNWLYAGVSGAYIMRQGYYVANGKTLRNWIVTKGGSFGTPPFQADEFDFWYNGATAARDLPGITGHVGDVKQGTTRDGGSFLTRSCNYSSWNSFFKENTYQVKRFNDFLSV